MKNKIVTELVNAIVSENPAAIERALHVAKDAGLFVEDLHEDVAAALEANGYCESFEATEYVYQILTNVLEYQF